MRSRDKIRIFIFKAGNDNFHVRLSYPGKETKEWDIGESLLEVEASILNKGEMSLDQYEMEDLVAALNIGIDEAHHRAIFGELALTHIARSHHLEESGLTWCGKSLPEEFKFLCVDHAISSVEMGETLSPCSDCLQHISDFLKQMTDI